MKKLHKLPGFLPVLLCLAGIMWLPVSVQAKVYDNYGILNEEETTALEKELAEIEEAYQFETAFLITAMWERRWIIVSMLPVLCR